MRYPRRLLLLFPSSHYAILSLFFLAGLEIIFSLHRFIPLLVGILLLILFIGIVLVRAEERGIFHPTQTILPSLAAFGLTGFALFLPTTQFIHFYFILSAVIFFTVLKYGAKQAYPTWNWMISLIVLFVCLATILGWRFHLYVPILFIISATFAVFFFISLQSLWRLAPTTSEALLLALCTAFVLTALTWVLQFLPLYYLVQTGVLVAFYYVLFHLVTAMFEGGLHRRDILEYSLVGTAALLFLLATARWI